MKKLWEKEEVELGETIASHSSFLTNRRIDIVLREVDAWEIQAWSRPKIQHVESYFAALKCLFHEVFTALNESELKLLKNKFEEYWENYVETLKNQAKHTPKQLYGLLFICDSINRIIRAALQRHGYFFVKIRREPRCIEDVLKIVEGGGGIFGKLESGGLSELPQNTNESK